MSLERRYLSGESLPVSHLNNDEGLTVYGRIIHNDWENDRAVKQATLEGELIIRKVHPVMSIEEARLKRPADTREGRREIERRATQTKTK